MTILPSAPVYPYDDRMEDSPHDDDERYARQLQQQERDAAMALDLQLQIERMDEIQRSNAGAAPHQVQQDEALARQYAMAEEQALQHAEAQNQQQRSYRGRRRCWATLVPCLIVVIGIVAVYFALQGSSGGGDGSGGGIVIPGIPWLEDNDPYEGMTPSEVAKWRNGGDGGLQLTMVNAMDPDWYDLFQEVVADWDNGTPDCLELSIMEATPESRCRTIEGVSKSCNGNYGRTDWRGINQVITDGFGYIVASTSRLNDFFLSQATEAQRRYTLCHELGHSFGLPHTDENFYNRDLGNCMDYTSNPQNNQQPDESNFEFLQELYGVLPRDNRNLRASRSNNNKLDTAFPEFVRVALEELEQDMASGDIPASTAGAKWRLLHSSPHAEAHSLKLDNGWSIHVHKVMATRAEE